MHEGALRITINTLRMSHIGKMKKLNYLIMQEFFLTLGVASLIRQDMIGSLVN